MFIVKDTPMGRSIGRDGPQNEKLGTLNLNLNLLTDYNGVFRQLSITAKSECL